MTCFGLLSPWDELSGTTPSVTGGDDSRRLLAADGCDDGGLDGIEDGSPKMSSSVRPSSKVATRAAFLDATTDGAGLGTDAGWETRPDALLDGVDADVVEVELGREAGIATVDEPTRIQGRSVQARPGVDARSRKAGEVEEVAV